MGILKEIGIIMIAMFLAYLYSINYLNFYREDNFTVFAVTEQFQARVVSFLAILTIILTGEYTSRRVKSLKNRAIWIYIILLFLFSTTAYSHLFSNIKPLLNMVLKVSIWATVTSLLIWGFYIRHKITSGEEASKTA